MKLFWLGEKGKENPAVIDDQNNFGSQSYSGELKKIASYKF